MGGERLIYVKNDNSNPYFNLALEEYVFNSLDKDDDYLLLWQNEPTIVVGKHQNTVEEINMDFIRENNINVVRRLSGGGAVYHDLGNLNFTFIIRNEDNSSFDFKRFTLPIINGLKNLGIDAEFNSRNDLAIKGKKFSGNSQYMRKNRLLHHGTLLFNSDLEILVKALNVSDEKIISKGIKSIRSRVTNISEHLSLDITISQFKELLLEYLFEGKEINKYELSREEIEEVEKLMNEKYMTWKWNYGESPRFNVKKSKKFNSGRVEALIYVEEGRIKNFKFYGDFFGSGDLRDVEDKLIGHRYDREEMEKVLLCVNMEQYFANISVDEILSCII